ncbi:HNH endonuclease [Cytobacillus firmus]|uniref:HNH endonuclease n=1 Tax=Cytobacillus firmus TaxID=1399 RepID=UPI0018CC7ED6|nr:HNH endonuclease [Cytobacillus firmus]
MGKSLIIFLVTIFIIFSTTSVSAENNAETTNNEKPITKEEYNQLVDNLKLDDVTKEHLYQQIIDQQKLISETQKEKVTDMYQYINYAAILLGIIVTVALALIAETGRRMKNEIKNHQEKINKILSSKEFDDKLKEIEDSIVGFKKYKQDSERQITELVELINEIKNNDIEINLDKGNENTTEDAENRTKSLEDEGKHGFISPVKRVTRDLKAFRLIKQLANGRCDLCEKNDGVDLYIHHILPRKDGGTDDIDNLAVLCANCNHNIASGTNADKRDIEKIKLEAEKRLEKYLTGYYREKF